jgi:hypothetical protein
MSSELVSLVGQIVCTSDAEQRCANLENALKYGFPVVAKQAAHNRSLAIVGGGPSVADDLDVLRTFDEIWCVNGSLDWLVSNGIVPTGYVIVDPEPIMAQYLQSPPKETTYYVGSICHPEVFKALADRNVVLWHPLMDDVPFPKGEGQIGGGPTILTRVPMLAFAMGHRDVHMFGADSSYEGDQHHIYDAPKDPLVRVALDNVIYDSCGVFVHQVAYFQQILHWYQTHEAIFEIHGRGLGPAILRATMHQVEDFTNDKSADHQAA